MGSMVARHGRAVHACRLLRHRELPADTLATLAVQVFGDLGDCLAHFRLVLVKPVLDCVGDLGKFSMYELKFGGLTS
jgi:hypothetical protein